MQIMHLFNPENSGIGPGLERLNPGISGLEKRPGSRDWKPYFDISRVKFGSTVGISLVSKSVTEIQNNAGVLAAILISASHQMWAKMDDHADQLASPLFYRFCKT